MRGDMPILNAEEVQVVRAGGAQPPSCSAMPITGPLYPRPGFPSPRVRRILGAAAGSSDSARSPHTGREGHQTSLIEKRRKLRGKCARRCRLHKRIFEAAVRWDEACRRLHSRCSRSPRAPSASSFRGRSRRPPWVRYTSETIVCRPDPGSPSATTTNARETSFPIPSRTAQKPGNASTETDFARGKRDVHRATGPSPNTSCFTSAEAAFETTKAVVAQTEKNTNPPEPSYQRPLPRSRRIRPGWPPARHSNGRPASRTGWRRAAPAPRGRSNVPPARTPEPLR